MYSIARPLISLMVLLVCINVNICNYWPLLLVGEIQCIFNSNADPMGGGWIHVGYQWCSGIQRDRGKGLVHREGTMVQWWTNRRVTVGYDRVLR